MLQHTLFTLSMHAYTINHFTTMNKHKKHMSATPKHAAFEERAYEHDTSRDNDNSYKKKRLKRSANDSKTVSPSYHMQKHKNKRMMTMHQGEKKTPTQTVPECSCGVISSQHTFKNVVLTQAFGPTLSI